MKKVIAILLIVLFPFIAAAEELNSFNPDDFQCALQPDGTLLLVNYAGNEKRVVIPDAIDGYPVTTIGYSAFYEKDIESVYIPKGISKIEANPFQGSKVKEIRVSLENSTYEVTDGILYNKREHRLVSFPSALVAEEFETLYGTAGEAYEIPYGTEIIGESSFMIGYGKPDIVLPDTVTTIEEFAFWETGNKVYVPESVVHIHESNFGMDDTGVYLECMPGSAIERFYLNNGRCYPREGLYYPVLPFDKSDGQGIEQVEGFRYPVKRTGDFRYFLVKDVTAIIYDYNGQHETLTLPETLDGYPVSGVIHCSSEYLKKVVIPDSITRISGNPFSESPYLQEIWVSPDHPALFVEDGALMLRQGNVLLSYPRGRVQDPLVITGNVEIIGEAAFKGCELLHAILLPETVRHIHNYAFWDCWNLIYVHVPSVFRVESPYIDYDLDQAEPIFTASIDSTSFEDYYYSIDAMPSENLKTPLILGGTEDKRSSYSDSEYRYLFMKDGTASLLSYLGNEKDVVIPAELGGHPVSIIGEKAFYGKEMETVIIPEGVRFIGQEAFQDCVCLKSVSLPTSLLEINEFGFSGCCSLSAVSFPENLQEIGMRAFSGCTSLRSVSFAEGLKKIDGGAFEKCVSLESVVLPESLEIMYSAFEDCEGLQSVSIPAGLKELWNSFVNCKSLTSVSVPGRMTDTIDAFGTSCGMVYGNPFQGCENVIVNVPKYSIAECGCKINGIPFTYLDE